MHSWVVLGVLVGYLALLLAVAWRTRAQGAGQFYLAGRAAPWYVVAFGMIGTSLSGVTFLSVPGAVRTTGMSYLQVVVGYFLGYIAIAYILLPLYYRLRLTSIYGYLGQRFGPQAYTTGAVVFLISRGLGSAARLYLVAVVFQYLVFDGWGVPFWVGAALTVGFILLYTFRGGLGTVLWTDTLQTTAFLGAVGVTLWLVGRELSGGLLQAIGQSPYAYLVVPDPSHPHFVLKDLVAGALICLTMTGLDQDQMQKNLSIRTLPLAQRSMLTYGGALVVVNLLFVGLGVVLYAYADQTGVALPARTDQVYAALAFGPLGPLAAALFLVGLTAAAYSSADGSLTALTTSTCVDLLRVSPDDESSAARRTRQRTHLAMALATLLVVVGFRAAEGLGTGKLSVIQLVLDLATYTYGPLLGLYAVGLFTRWQPTDRWLPVVCALAPALTWLVGRYDGQLLGGYQFGFELLLVNGLFTALGCWALSRRRV
ncbi:MAG: sodium:solute symporter [Bacteroidia bacterium]|nr:sodium:solute symporter [Bacteroidia bacterium]